MGRVRQRACRASCPPGRSASGQSRTTSRSAHSHMNAHKPPASIHPLSPTHKYTNTQVLVGAVLWMPRYVTDQSLRTRCSLSPVNSVVISFIHGNKDTSFAIQPREISTHPCRECHASCIISSLTAARRKFQETRALHLVVWVEVRVNERA